MQRVLGTFFLVLFGAIFLTIGIWARTSMQPYDGGVLDTATVVDHEYQPDDDGSGTYAAIFEFETEIGRTVRVVDSFSSSNPPGIGSEISISYERDDPAGARNLDQPAWFPWIFIGIGGVALLLSLSSILPILLAVGLGAWSAVRRDGGGDAVFGALDPSTGRIPSEGPTSPYENPTGPSSTYD